MTRKKESDVFIYFQEVTFRTYLRKDFNQADETRYCYNHNAEVVDQLPLPEKNIFVGTDQWSSWTRDDAELLIVLYDMHKKKDVALAIFDKLNQILKFRMDPQKGFKLIEKDEKL